MDHPLLQLFLGTGPPSKPLPADASLSARYESWLRVHSTWLLPSLDAIRSLTLFLPGRFQEGGQISSEGIYTILNVIAVYHDHILDKPRALSAELRVDAASRERTLIQFAQGMLLFTHYTEVFMEMAAKRYFKQEGGVDGAQTRGSWYCIAAVEAIKSEPPMHCTHTQRSEASGDTHRSIFVLCSSLGSIVVFPCFTLIVVAS